MTTPTATADFAMTSQTLPTETVVPTPELSDDEAAFEAALEAARAAAPQVEEPPAQEAATVAPEPTPVTVETASKPAEPEKPAERVAPVMLKLMEREAKIAEREIAVKQFEQEVSQVREQVLAYETAQKNFQYDPVSYIRKMAPNIDLADLAKQLWYEKLGDVAPPEYRATKEARTVAGSVEQLRAEMQEERKRWAEERQREQAELAYNQYLGALGGFAKSVPEEYPLVKHFAKEDPDSVQRGLLKIAQQHAQQNGGAVLTPEECAKALNSRLQALQAKLPAPTVAPAPVKNEQPVATLRNKHTSVQPNRIAPDPEDEEALFQKALEAARAVRKQ